VQKWRRRRLFIMVLMVLLAAALALLRGQNTRTMVVRKFEGRRTLEQRLTQYGPAARARLKRDFARAGADYPPKKLTLVGLKQERELQVYAAGDDGDWRFVKSYPILGASGELGPKLKYGDCQVPEGIYRVVFLNPNSSYHLSLRLNYPNAFDRAMAKRDGRTELGGDIMIHGSDVSIGCLAMGDEASEDLFVLGYDTRIVNMRVILSPVDFRARRLPREMPDVPAWTDDLYGRMASRLAELPPAGDAR